MLAHLEIKMVIIKKIIWRNNKKMIGPLKITFWVNRKTVWLLEWQMITSRSLNNGTLLRGVDAARTIL